MEIGRGLRATTKPPALIYLHRGYRGMRITILNFDKFNPRKDYETMPWVRLQTKLPFDPKFDTFSPAEKWFWVFLLCTAGMENRGLIVVENDWLCRHSGLSESEISASLTKLVKYQLIECDFAQSDRLADRHTDLTYKRTNKRTRDTSTEVDPAPAFHEIVEIWNANKGGKLPGVKQVSAKRQRRLSACWKENPDLEYWKKLISDLGQSAFHTGDNDRSWVASLDFLLQPGKHIELSERFSATTNTREIIHPLVVETKK